MATVQQDINPTLQQELRKLTEQLLAQIPPETAALMRRATMSLVQSDIAGRALKEGSRAPDFTLPNAVGKEVSLRDLLATGPVVVTFYRGAW